MRNLIALLCILFISQATIAQDKSLIIEGATPNLYLVHQILPKENYYSVGRMYNVSPKELATYNNLPFEKGLSLGQSVKIPLSASNFTQGEPATKAEALIPLYHIVQPKEGLYRISMTYNKVPLEILKKWNNLTTDVVSNGTKLIVGYLKVLKEQSSLAQKGVSMPKTDLTVIPKDDKKMVVKPDVPKERFPVVLNPDKQKQPDIEPKEKPQLKEVVPEENKDEVIKA